MVIGGDDYLALSLDGVVVVRKKEQRAITWQELAAASVDDRVLCLELETGETVRISERFSGIELDELAQRINRTQQRAIMGLISLRAEPPA